MADKSKIEWTGATLNPIRARNKKTGKVGWHCEHATTGCVNCYAEGFNKRLGTGLDFKPAHRHSHGIELFLDEEMLTQPLRWKRPRMIFVCSMTDLFADFVPDEWIDKVFAVIALCPQHTFHVLTKRAARMRDYFERHDTMGRIEIARWRIGGARPALERAWPLPNVWLGVSTERQQEADERIPLLLQTPAAVRFLSVEPMLGRVDLCEALGMWWNQTMGCFEASGPSGFNRNPNNHAESAIDWVIVGGESGKDARPMHPDWARSLRDQCAAAGVAFFFKQWGEWGDYVDAINVSRHHALCGAMGGAPAIEKDWPAPLRFLNSTKDISEAGVVSRVGKKAAGRHLDGVLHDAMPQADGRGRG